MATEFNGIVYFPTKAAFFEGAVSESLEAKYGIKAVSYTHLDVYKRQRIMFLLTLRK